MIVFWAQSVLAVVTVEANGLVDLAKYDFSIHQDLKLATTDPSLRRAMIPSKCLLALPVAEALSRVQAALKLHRAGLKIFDCYRPAMSATAAFRYPDRHERAAAVDVTLIDRYGRELEMSSRYEGDGGGSNRQQTGKGSRASVKNESLLRSVMANGDFYRLEDAWWHFEFKDWRKFPALSVPIGGIK